MVSLSFIDFLKQYNFDEQVLNLTNIEIYFILWSFNNYRFASRFIFF